MSEGRASDFWLKGLCVLFAVFIISTRTYGQTTSVTGVVIDAVTKEHVPYVSIYFKNGVGTTADSSGHFEINTDKDVSQLFFSYIGYAIKKVEIRKGTAQTISVELSPDTKGLKTIVVKSRNKIKYRNKDNPAVELIRHVIENKEKNKPEAYDYVEYEQYEKLQLSLSNVSQGILKSSLMNKYLFILNNVDSTTVPGKALVPFYLEEKLSDEYYRKSPEKKRSVIIADKKVNYSDLVDSAGFSTYLKRLYEDVNIYDNNISVFTTAFLSPIADMAPSFYMYFIRDTLVDASGRKLVQLYFTPRNTNDFLFRGTMYITLDSNYGIQKLDMTISRNINMNWIRDMHINQEFERNEADGRYHMIRSNMMAEVGGSKGSKNGVFGERTISFKNYTINKPQSPAFYDGPSVVDMSVVAQAPESFWVERRHDTLTGAESRVYANTDTLRNMKSFRHMMGFMNFLLSGYIPIAQGKFEFGPAAAFYSYDPVEGFILRLGGRTTPKLSKRIYFETYAAFGLKDELWKGYLGVTYSLNNKSIYTYPLNYIRVSGQRETNVPGRELQFMQEDNVLLSIRRGKNDKWLYNTIYQFDYVHELASHFSYDLGFKNWRQEPAGAISYVKEVNNSEVSIPQVTTSEVGVTLRWAPHEQFYQGKVYRIPIINKYPIFTFRYSRGLNGVWNGEYSYNRYNISIDKRTYMAQFGYTDMLLDAGYISGKLPFPLLTIHWANQTYAYDYYTYNMMNFLEFVSDRYVGFTIDHHFNGFFFNRIPLIKKLNILEIVGAKVLYGGLRDENNPAKDPSLFKFLTYNGVPETYSLNNGPYIEGNVGVENVFKVLRIDLIKRFSYLDHPLAPEWGLRVRLKFNF